MNKEDFNTTILVNKTPKEAFAAITNVRGWWSENIEGETEKLGDEFTYRYEDVHYCKVKLTEVVPNYGSLRKLITKGKGLPNPKEDTVGKKAAR